MAAGSSAPRPVPEQVEVVVVGAGAAGLAAARTLAEAGAAVQLLEARERIGGRAFTAHHGSAPFDRGCGWLHSGNRNDWRLVAEKLGLGVDRSPSPWRKQSGGLGFDAAEQEAFRVASDAFYERLEARAAHGPDVAAASLLDPGDRWNGLLEAVGTYINGCTFDRLSVIDYSRYADTGVNWRATEGYGTLVAAYGAGLPVRLGCPVTLIDHAGPRLRLTTPQGVLEADRVVVTVPPTLLARETLRFAPALPDKVTAAANLPLGVANKVFLAVDRLEAIPSEGHLFGRIDRAETGSYHLRPLGRPLVEGYYGGPFAAELERDGARAFTAFALEELTRLLGGEACRHLTPIAATAWAGDPWSRGSYSHALPGHADDRAVLAAPVDERLFFAGEACSRHDFSTAHGAYRTGIAAAQALLASL